MCSFKCTVKNSINLFFKSKESRLSNQRERKNLKIIVIIEQPTMKDRLIILAKEM